MYVFFPVILAKLQSTNLATKPQFLHGLGEDDVGEARGMAWMAALEDSRLDVPLECRGM